MVGLGYLFGPELGLTLWPTPVPAVLMRFIGSIILGNAVGAWMISRQGTWEGARALFAVALVYGAIILPALLYHLILGTAPAVLWMYAMVDALFLGPIIYIFLKFERTKGTMQ